MHCFDSHRHQQVLGKGKTAHTKITVSGMQRESSGYIITMLLPFSVCIKICLQRLFSVWLKIAIIPLGFLLLISVFVNIFLIV